MKLLLDTHALVRVWLDAPQVSATVRTAVLDEANEITVSPASVWEMATKHRLGRWPDAGPLLNDFDRLVSASGYRVLPISAAHAHLAGAMAGEHRDPFDRLLAAQAIRDHLTLVTVDPAFAGFPVPVLWS